MIMESLFDIGAICKSKSILYSVSHIFKSFVKLNGKDNTICTFLGSFFYHNDA